MARTTTPLNSTQIEKAKPQAKEFTLADGKGLYLLIKPNGAKLWRFNYYKPFTQPKKRALIGIGRYKGKLVAHGMRSIASTYLNEKGYDSELIEVALSHLNNDRIKTAYDRGERLEQRFKLLQAWGDFIEESAQGALPQYHLKMVA